MSAPDISVIVPHYDDLVRLDRCLDAIASQTVPRERFEIVVADNMSPAGESAVARAIGGRARLTLARDKGAGPARNAGVAASRGRLLAFTDADCVPDPGWLAAGIAALDRYDLAGGRMAVVIEHGGPKSGAESFELVFAFDNEAYVKKQHFTVTANLFCPRAVFDRTGPFKTGVSEDLEWCIRSRDAGFRIGYAPDALVSHPPRTDWAGLRKKWVRINAELFEYALTRPGGRLRWFARSLALPASALAHAPRVLRSPKLSAAERARALGMLARVRMWRFVDANLRTFGMRK